MHKKDLVYLTQTDTTMGFVSQSEERLTQIKQRPPYKHYIKALPSLEVLTSFTRVPNTHKNTIRRARQTTFIFPDGNSYRIIRKKQHLSLVEKLGWAYTTSANLSGEKFDLGFATASADIIVGYPYPETKLAASSVLKLNNIRMKRIR